jgi:hypothetical protein
MLTTLKQNKKYIILCLSLFIMALVVYRHFYINELPNPDSIWNGRYHKESYKWEMALGRYMIRYWQLLFLNTINPVLNTILAIAVNAISAVLIIRFLNINNIILQVTAAVTLILSNHVLSGLSYYYCYVYYAFASLFMVIAVILLQGKKGRHPVIILIRALAALILICISLATYQAYISVYVTLVAIWFLNQMLIYITNDTADNIPEARISEANKSEDHIKDTIITTLIYIAELIAATLVYLISNKILININNITMDSGRGFDTIGQLNIKTVITGITSIYTGFIDSYFGTGMLDNDAIGIIGNVSNQAIISLKFMNAILLIMIIIGLISLIITSTCKPLLRNIFSILLILTIAMYPVFTMLIVLVAPGCDIYDTTGVMMLPCMSYIWLVWAVVMDNAIKKYSYNIQRMLISVIALLSVLIVYTDISYADDTQSYMLANMERISAVGDMLSQDIDKYVEKNSDLQVCVLGTIEYGNYPDDNEDIRARMHWTTAYYRTVWENVSAQQSIWKKYMKDYYGIKYEAVDTNAAQTIYDSEEFGQMPCYPEKGSVAEVDGIMVVKLGENDISLQTYK